MGDGERAALETDRELSCVMEEGEQPELLRKGTACCAFWVVGFVVKF